ncbi:MAG: two-component system sensor histidine kinase KdbD [Burkholderiales bacterium PBB2]|nr:MAG: two-component system sensor histidine kinase KdbD [Burkholderiales bacterium PBB2]
MTDERPNPDALLAQIREQESAEQRGRLRIYFGSSAGVGKTFAMLQAARKLMAEGRDVLAGVVVTHGRSETQALLDGLPQLPLRELEYRGKKLPEFDLDGVLARRPSLVLVDELAHSNAPGSRHPKRWQDVEELLARGIDVYSTLNVQHLESLNDVVGGITGVRVQETLPDTFFDRADEVVMVDTPADELLARLAAGKVYMGPQAQRAAQNFFRKGNLMALRELALRRTADRVEDDVQAWRSNERVAQVWKTEAAILCAIGPSPAAESVLRSAAQLAQQLNVSWHAVYVETPALQRLPDAQRDRILRTVRLAHELGAQTAVLPAQDLAPALLAYAREHNLSKLLLGRSAAQPAWRRWWAEAPLQQRLAEGAPELDVITVAAAPLQPARRSSLIPADQQQAQEREQQWQRHVSRYGLAALACGATALISWPLQAILAQPNIVMLFLLSVVGVALRLGRGPAALASVLSVGLFDFFFVQPRLSFAVSDVQYLLTFAVMLAVGLITGQLTAGLRYQAQVLAERESRSRALFELTSDLAGALQTEAVLQVAEGALAEEVHGEALLYVLDLNDALQPSPRQASLVLADQPDAGTARWALDHGQAAGLSTDTLAGSAWFYLPLQAPMRTRGVLALKPKSSRSLMLPELRAQLETYGRIIGQALERVHYVEVAQQALVHIEGERLRNSLLSALSHDLRTPLAGLYGLAQTLDRTPALPPQARELSAALQQQAQRISAMVNNLLDMARLQSGAVRLNPQWQPVEEVVGTALQALQPALAGHALQLDIPAGLPLLNLDAALMERVLCNLIENALKYTPPDSRLRISAELAPASEQALLLRVADNGPGLPPGREEQLFAKFSRGERESSTPGVGLGLAICRAIVQAHGGQIHGENLPGGGACFVIRLPLGEPPALPAGDEPEPGADPDL